MFSNCITWLSQLVVVTDFKQRPDGVWQPGDWSFLLLARLQAITVVSHAEPTICQPYFCLHHRLTEHQKAIRDRQGWQFAYFSRQVHSKACFWGYFRSNFFFSYLGESFHRGDQKRAAASGFILWFSQSGSTITRKLVRTCTPPFVAQIFQLSVVSTGQVVANSDSSIALVGRTWVHWTSWSKFCPCSCSRV